MPRKNSIHVVPQNGRWGIKQSGLSKSLGSFDRKSDAIKTARNVSRALHSELFIHKKNGEIGSRDSHGNDPFPPRG